MLSELTLSSRIVTVTLSSLAILGVGLACSKSGSSGGGGNDAAGAPLTTSAGFSCAQPGDAARLGISDAQTSGLAGFWSLPSEQNEDPDSKYSGTVFYYSIDPANQVALWASGMSNNKGEEADCMVRENLYVLQMTSPTSGKLQFTPETLQRARDEGISETEIQQHVQNGAGSVNLNADGSIVWTNESSSSDKSMTLSRVKASVASQNVDGFIARDGKRKQLAAAFVAKVAGKKLVLKEELSISRDESGVEKTRYSRLAKDIPENNSYTDSDGKKVEYPNAKIVRFLNAKEAKLNDKLTARVETRMSKSGKLNVAVEIKTGESSHMSILSGHPEEDGATLKFVESFKTADAQTKKIVIYETIKIFSIEN